MDRLADDHANARRLAQAVRKCKSLGLSDQEPDTNIVIFHVDKQWGTAAQFSESLKSVGVLTMPFGPQSVRLVTHLDVCAQAIARACEAIEHVANRSLLA
jgi:threonine aldolase